MTVYIVIFDKAAYRISSKLFSDIASYIDDHYVETHINKTSEVMRRQKQFWEMDLCESISLPEPSNVPLSKAATLEDALQQMDESFSEMLLRKIDESRSQITGNASSAIFRILFSFRRSRSISGSVILFFLASIISFWFSSIIYACLTEPAGFSLIPRTFFPIPTTPEDTTIISFPLEWLLIPFRFSSFQFIFLVGINKRSRKRVCGDTFFCFFFHYRIIILQ